MITAPSPTGPALWVGKPSLPPISSLEPPSEKKPLQTAAITIGTVGITVIGFLRLFPRFIMRNIALALQKLEKRGVNSPLIPKSEKVLKLAEDRKRLDRRLVSLLGITLMLQSPLYFQTAINAEQPTMLLHGILGLLYQLGSLFTSNVVLRTAFSFISGLFIFSGKQNDIGNTRVMDSRKEWDINRLKAVFSPDQFDFEHAQKELGSFARYIMGDLKDTFSLKPWQELSSSYKEKSTWLEPNPLFTCIAAQVGTLANMANLASLKSPQSLQGVLSGMPFPLMILRNLASSKTEMVRAWQNRTDLDGILLLLGQPLAFVGTAFFISKKYFHLNGLAHIASPLVNIGTNLNTKYRREAINYVIRLYELARQNPQLEAAQFLTHFQEHPDALKKLKKRTGTMGLEFILESLRSANTQRRLYGTPLAQALYPLTVSKEA